MMYCWLVHQVAGQNKCEEDGEPAVDRKAGIEMDGCAGVETALPIAPMTRLKSCSASSEPHIHSTVCPAVKIPNCQTNLAF